jgi:hypothetical protein
MTFTNRLKRFQLPYCQEIQSDFKNLSPPLSWLQVSREFGDRGNVICWRGSASLRADLHPSRRKRRRRPGTPGPFGFAQGKPVALRKRHLFSALPYASADPAEREERSKKKREGCRVGIPPFRENQRREKMGHPFVSRGPGKPEPGAPGRPTHSVYGGLGGRTIVDSATSLPFKIAAPNSCKLLLASAKRAFRCKSGLKVAHRCG